MGITVMIIMGLLSVLAISSIDFDGLDELRDRLEEARADAQDQEEGFQDTSELGWLDVETEGPASDQFNTDLLSFAAEDIALAEFGTDTAFGAEFEEMANDFDSLEGDKDEENMAFGPDVATDLWPLEAQSETDEDETAQDVAAREEQEMIELAGFNADEDAIELPYSQKQDDEGNMVPPEVTVSHHDGYTEVGVDGEMVSFSHTASSDFKGLDPEDVMLRVA